MNYEAAGTLIKALIPHEVHDHTTCLRLCRGTVKHITQLGGGNTFGVRMMTRRWKVHARLHTLCITRLLEAIACQQRKSSD